MTKMQQQGLVFGISLAWGLPAMYLSVFVAKAVEKAWHPNDPDPVDFRIGGIFLLVWFLTWLVGTLAMVVISSKAKWDRRDLHNNSAHSQPQIPASE